MKELIEIIVINGIITPLDATPTVGQPIIMKKLELDGELNEEIIELIMVEEKLNQKEKLIMPYDQLRKYLPKEYTNKQIEKNIEDDVMISGKPHK